MRKSLKVNLCIVTRKRPVTGEYQSESRYLALGDNFAVTNDAECATILRTQIQIFVPGECGTRKKVRNLMIKFIT